MKILYLAHRIPYPPNKGDKIRAFNEIRYLHRNHTVDVCCLIDNPRDKQYVEPLRKYCRTLSYATINAKIKKLYSVLSIPFSNKTCTEIYFHSALLQQQIDDLIEQNNYDLIFIYCSSMASYVRDKTDIAKVIDFVDIDSDKWIQYSSYAPFPLKWLFRREGRILAELEHQLLSETDASFLVTEREARFFAHLDNGHKVVAIPNGIDREFFNPNATPDDPKLREELYVCFTGAMDYFPNEDGVLFFYDKIFPLVRTIVPNLKFYIVGSNPTPRLQKLAEDSSVVVTGTVDDIRPYLKHAQLAVIPLRMARGIQNKILEAVSMGIPVVTTTNAAEGLTLKPGTDFIVEDDPESFANQAIDLLNNPDQQRDLVQSGQKQLDLQYDWNRNLKSMEQVLEGVVNKKNAEGGI